MSIGGTTLSPEPAFPVLGSLGKRPPSHIPMLHSGVLREDLLSVYRPQKDASLRSCGLHIYQQPLRCWQEISQVDG